MPPQVIRNQETGELALYDTDSQQFLGQILKHQETGAYGLWDKDTKTMKPIQMPQDLMEKIDVQRQLQPAQQTTTGPLGIVGPGGRIEPMAAAKAIDPMTIINAPFEAAGTGAGQLVQGAVEPYIGGRGADIAGALTSGTIQTLGPGLILRGGQLAAKGLGAMLPGSQAGKMEGAIEKARTSLKFGTEKASGEFLTKAGALEKVPGSDVVPLNGTRRILNAIIAEAESHGQTPGTSGFLSYAKDLRERIAGSGGAPSVHWVDKELSQAGEMTKALKGGESHPGYKAIFRAMAGDLENSAPQTVPWKPSGSATARQQTLIPQPSIKRVVEGSAGQLSGPAVQWKKIVETPQPSKVVTEFGEVGYPVQREITPSGAGGLVRQKDIAYRRMAGWDDLTDEFEKLVKTKRGMGGAEDINANQLLDRLKQKEFLRESLRPEDWKDVEVIFKKIADMAPLPPPRGAMFGAGRFAGTVGGIASPLALMGVDPGTAMAVGGTAAALADVSRLLLPRPWGRKALRAVLESGPINQAKIDSLYQLARLASHEATSD